MILQGNCLDKLKELPDNSVDSIVTDPPYELGFMGKSWDNTGIANNKEMWKECLRVLKPGGHLLAFSGTRTYHRMASAIEDAGFEIRDMIEWVYGSGFPKSLNIGKAVDKLQGNEREVVGENKNIKGRTLRDIETLNVGAGAGNNTEITKGTSEWEGWGTALKPAHEPICMARKPLSEKTVAENCLKWGTGGINIDESRVGTGAKKWSEPKGGIWSESVDNGAKLEDNPLGRFPANLIHDGSEEVRECFPDTKGDSPNRKERKGGHRDLFVGTDNNQVRNQVISDLKFTDSGNASRFFKSIIYQAKASKSERNNFGNESFIKLEVIKNICDEKQQDKSLIKEEIIAKLLVDMEQSQIKVIEESGIRNRKDTEWNTMLFGKILMEKYQQDIQSIIKTKTNSTMKSTILKWLIHLLTKEYMVDVNLLQENGGNHVENAEQSNELSFIINEKMVSLLGVENVVLGTQLKIRLSDATNFHSTVKPLKLMEYLIKMVTPKGGLVLDPFAGSGSTLVAAKQNGFQYIGIELTEEYIPIIEARLSAVETEGEE